jgi:hypothetical protein
MSSMMVFCPTTASAVYTGIEMDETTFTKLPDVVSRMSCSACGAVHLWTTRKVWLADAGWQAKNQWVGVTMPLKLVA